MYKVIRERNFYDMQDSTKHEYSKGDNFPWDSREIAESRLLELSTDLNLLKEPLIKLESELEGLTKKEIIERFNEENYDYDVNESKTELIQKYEYQKSRIRLLEEANKLDLEVNEDLSNYEITELILQTNK